MSKKTIGHSISPGEIDEALKGSWVWVYDDDIDDIDDYD